MRTVWTSLLASVVVSLAGAESASIPIADLKRDKSVDFEREILPLFKKNCLACHNATDAKGDLVLETPQRIAKGGESGPAVIPGKGLESLLLKLSAHQDKPVMPPRNNKAGAVALTGDELGLLKLWIDQGATGIVSTALGPVHWQPLPSGMKGITAVALSRDGQYAACGRANQIFVYHLPTKSLVTRLTDPALLEAGLGRGLADRDIIQSLTFSPDSKTLASGAYRSVKLWERKENTPEFTLPYVAAGPVRALAASGDGEIVVTGGEDGTAKAWRVKDRELLHEFRGHTGAVTAVSISSDNLHLATAGADKTLRIWKLKDPTTSATILTTNSIESLAWTANDQIAEVGGDNLIRLWKIDSKSAAENQPSVFTFSTNPPASLSAHAQNVKFVAIIPGKRELASASKEGVVKIWNLENNQPIREIVHGAEISAMAIRLDGKRLATAGANNITKLWEFETGKMLAEIKGDRLASQFAREMEVGLNFAKFEVEHQKATLAEAEKTEKAETETLKKATEHKEKSEKAFAEKTEAFTKAQEAKVASDKALEDLKVAIAAAREKKDALTKSRDELAAAEKGVAEKAGVNNAAFEKAAAEKNAFYQAVLDSAFAAKLAQLSALESKANAEKEAANAALAEARKIAEQTAAEKNTLAIAAVDKYAEAKVIFDAASGVKGESDKVLAEAQAKAKAGVDAFAANEKIIAEADASTKSATDKIAAAVKAVTDAETATKLAEGVKNGAVQAFESNTLALKKAGEALAKTKNDLKEAEAAQAQATQIAESAKKSSDDSAKPIQALAFTADNKLLLIANDDGIIRSFSSDGGDAGEIFPGHTGRISSLLALGADRFASAGADQNLRVWLSEPEWALTKVLGDGSEKSPFTDRVLALDFSEDGRMLATGGGFPSRSGELKLWKAATGELLSDIPNPHSDTVVALDFSFDGKSLASGGADKFLRVFDVQSGRQTKTFEGHTHHVQGVSWKRDGRVIASAGADKVVKIWDTASGEQRKTIEGFGKELTSVQFLAPTKVDRNFEALVSSADTQVKFVKEDGNHIRGFGGATDFVTSAAATVDGRLVLAGGLDGVLRAWNGETAAVIATFEPPKEDGTLATK